MKYLLITALLIAALSFVPDQRRYFYIVYVAEGGETGCFTMQTDNYPSLHSLYTIAHKDTKKDGVIITNIIELNKTDFSNFSNTK
jgi:hypothetical protein